MDTKNFEKKMETISPFELKNQLIDMADESLKKTARTMLNAGRGNPNWIATTPREAFFLLGQFGLEECARSSEYGEEMVGLAGIPEKRRIATRFTQSPALPPASKHSSKKTIPPTAPNSWSKPITTC